MTVLVDNIQSLFDAASIQNLIEAVVNKALEYEGMIKDYQVSIVLTDNIKIKELNREHRGIDRATDVLSFPMLYSEDELEQGKFTDMDIDTGEVVLGDIVISLERAHEQSIEYGHSFEREVAYLTVHGILHLLGYDHETDDDRKIMREKEESILKLLNLTR